MKHDSRNATPWFSQSPDDFTGYKAEQPFATQSLAMPAIAAPLDEQARPAHASQSSPVYLDGTLPFVVGAAPGSDVSLKSILTQAFGPGYNGYTDFWLGYYGASALQNWDFSYWNPKNPSVATWLVNGSDIGASSTSNFNSVDVTTANVSTATLQAGNDIGDLAFIIVPVAYDSSGNPTEYDQFSVITVNPDLIAKNAGKGDPTPSDIIKSAKLFSNEYSGVPNDNDCHKIACAVAGAAGAAFDDFTTGSLNPKQNESGGFWRVVYRGSQKNPVSDWQSLVKPGDIVRMGWQGGGQHTTTVLAVNKDGSIKVFDNDKFVNGVEEIGTHTVNYDTQTIASTITIFRLSPDHLYLIDGTGQGESLAGTSFNDQIVGNGGNDTLSGWTGNDVLQGGAGNDTLIGGAGADTLTGGAGDDTFVYKSVSESTSSKHDTITDFDASADMFKLSVTVSGIDKTIGKGTLSTAKFDANLHTALGTHLGAGDAILFTPNKGTLAGHTFLIVDANGQAGYQAGHDYVFDITGAANLSNLSVHDFG